MTEEEKQKKQKQLDEEILLALLLALSVAAEIDAAGNDITKFPENVREQAAQLAASSDFKAVKDELSKSIDEDRAPDFGNGLGPNIKAAVQAAVVKALIASLDAEYFQVVGVDDSKQCEACRKLQGKIFTVHGLDPRYPKIDNFLADDGLHPNCRCYLHYIKAPKMKIDDLNNLAKNSKAVADEVLYTSIVAEDTEDDIPTYEFGQSLVMLSPLGTFEGTAADGTTKDEIIDDEAVQRVIANWDGKELLLDIDHKSMRDFNEIDSTAAGWVYELKAVTNLGRLNGLYGRIRWTDVGRKLVETRTYRFISPVFKVDETGRPYLIVNAALTNRPALETISPILNSKKNDGDTIVMKTEEKETTEKDDVKNSCDDSKKEDVVENSEAEETAEEKAEEKAEVKEATDSEEKAEEKAEAKEATDSEEKADDKDDDKDDEVQNTDAEESKEVIKLEVLNSAPATKKTSENEALDYALTLKGSAFFDYLRKHPELKNM